MKSLQFALLLSCAVAFSLGSTGCKKTPKGPTPIPGARTTTPGGGTPFPPATPGGGLPPADDPGAVGRTPSGISTADRELFEGMAMDREVFKANTVLFDFDRSAIRPGERAKIEDVANYLKANPANKLLVEGHCDERGTEEYNRALGERRALSIREYLANLGIGADRIRTLSYGEDRPADEGHDEAAWAKNRRGEFILLKP